MARAVPNAIVGASTRTWPSGQLTLTVTYTPGRTIAPGNTLVTGDPASLNAEVAGASIQSITHLDYDHISGVGTVPSALFGPESVRGQVRFKQIKTSEPVTVVFSVTTAPTADRDFPTALAPMDVALKSRIRRKSRRFVRRAVRRAARRKPSFFRRAARSVWSRLKRLNPFSGVGEMTFSDSELDDVMGEVLGAAMNEEDGEFDAFLGAIADEMYDDASTGAFDDLLDDDD